MALTYHGDKDWQQPVETELFKGWDYYRHFTCPRGEMAGYITAGTGTLDLGDFLPTAWGGPSSPTGLIYEPKLQSVIPHNKPKATSQYILETHWISINYTGTYPSDGTTYVELSRTRVRTRKPFDERVRTVGIAATNSDAGIPKRGEYLDNTPGGGFLGPCASQVQILENVHAGRVFVFTEWVGMRPITLVAEDL